MYTVKQIVLIGNEKVDCSPLHSERQDVNNLVRYHYAQPSAWQTSAATLNSKRCINLKTILYLPEIN